MKNRKTSNNKAPEKDNQEVGVLLTHIIPRILLLILVAGFLIGPAPMIGAAAIMDITGPEESVINITEPLVFSTLTGNRTQDYITCVDIDEAGNLYAAGITQDTGDDYDNSDSFLMKINGTDFSPIYYTTIKGSSYDMSDAYAVGVAGLKVLGIIE